MKLGGRSEQRPYKSTGYKPVLPRATDRQIDRLVYDLYGLTAEEIAIVEGQE